MDSSYIEKDVKLTGASERITLGMGCFWGPEALFGSMPGVLRTRVGFAGGTAPDPTYRDMRDHTETVQLEFDGGILSFEELVALFWERHNPVNINGYKGRQYQSLLFYENEIQRSAIEHVLHDRQSRWLQKPDTEIMPYDRFHLAEERHQKYYLKRFPHAVATLMSRYAAHEQLIDSTIAARLNGLAKGYTNMERIKREVEMWRISDSERNDIIDLITSIRW